MGSKRHFNKARKRVFKIPLLKVRQLILLLVRFFCQKGEWALLS